jgi:hypothetical protein
METFKRKKGKKLAAKFRVAQITITLLLVVASNSFLLGQENIIQGNYLLEDLGFLAKSGAVYKFNMDKTFKHINSVDSKKIIDQGKYEVKNDTLILNYEVNPINSKPSWFDIKNVKSNDTRSLSIKVVDYTQKISLSHSHVNLFNKKENVISLTTDAKGEIDFHILAQNNFDELKVFTMGYEVLTIPFHKIPKGNSEIICYLKPTSDVITTTVSKPTTLKFYIQEISEKEIILITSNQEKMVLKKL